MGSLFSKTKRFTSASVAQRRPVSGGRVFVARFVLSVSVEEADAEVVQW